MLRQRFGVARRGLAVGVPGMARWEMSRDSIWSHAWDCMLHGAHRIGI
jgi:hypothetical protein